MKEQAKYRQLADELREQIMGGTFAVGDTLPTEQELQETHSLSRQTVRQAIAILERDGLVYRRRGSGTYIGRMPRKQTAHLTVGVITTYITDYIFPSIIRGIESTLSQNNCTMNLVATGSRLDTERDILRNLLDHPVDGLIVEGTKSALPNPNIKLYEELQKQNIPMVFINNYYSQLQNAVHVVMNDYEGGKQITECLIREGHTHIAGIFKSDDMQGHERFRGYADAIAQAGLPLRDEDVAWFSTDNKQAFLQGALRYPDFAGVTALVCYNDEIATAARQYLASHPTETPVTLFSFDNSIYSRLSLPPLRSLGHPKEQLGVAAAAKLLRMIAGQHEESEMLSWEFPSNT